ncbi:alpha-L-rhamnosidase C-terminal domain-containing protein [Candidatus Pristimantibacillus sp. PTI5]|uniref:alpha-L-rhamnosidase C-terminal domain-containing protein n=1 Tax=Candidatus Pristimantibacillus sp. PTI5 TaxID=3400422 RepID=UPI003B0125A3
MIRSGGRHVRGSHHSVRGLIHVDFSHGADGLKQLHVSIPPNTTAVVKLPISRLLDVYWRTELHVNMKCYGRMGRCMA